MHEGGGLSSGCWRRDLRRKGWLCTSDGAWGGKGCATLAAEMGPRFIDSTTRRARHGERSPAASTELAAFQSLVATAWAFHVAHLLPPEWKTEQGHATVNGPRYQANRTPTHRCVKLGLG